MQAAQAPKKKVKVNLKIHEKKYTFVKNEPAPSASFKGKKPSALKPGSAKAADGLGSALIDPEKYPKLVIPAV